MFIADSPALDFLNSIAIPADTQVEWLRSGEDLLAWLNQARLVPPAVLETMRKNVAPERIDAVAAEARTLREWFRSFVVAHKGQPIDAGASTELEPLNQVLAHDQEFGQIAAAEPHDHEHGEHEHLSALVWRPARRWTSPDTLLLPVARAMADLICNDDFSRVKACEGPACTLLFIDRTKRHGRRWCSMAVCGNRAKQAAHRQRLHQAQQ
ncbi:MAG TPA: ABATE domain-containing protein [Devosiaceae bacterium]|jgi:predicted RNA-binding Zn ribbon-like protein